MYKNRILDNKNLELIQVIDIPSSDNIEFVKTQNKLYSAGGAGRILQAKELLELKVRSELDTTKSYGGSLIWSYDMVTGVIKEEIIT